MPILDSAGEMRALLRNVRSVAVVGASPNPTRPSHGVAEYLLGHTDWQVWFVNPNAASVCGQPTFASLDDLPDAPDLVDVFRRVEHIATTIGEAIDAGAGGVWLQLGLRDDAAAKRASDAGLAVVQDHCLKVEHQRLIGGL